MQTELWFPSGLSDGMDGFVTVGRSGDCDVQIRDFTISSIHARLYPVRGTEWVFLKDAGSRNGTAHNGELISPADRAELLSGDEVQLGRWVMVFLSTRDFFMYLTDSL